MNASPDAREYLLKEFRKRLTVEAIPHTLVLSVRFRSGDAALSATIVNALIEEHRRLDGEERVLATRTGAEHLNEQLRDLRARVIQDTEKLAAFQKQYGILSTTDIQGDGRQADVTHNSSAAMIDALGRELVNATADRIVREVAYRAASTSDPEGVLASNAKSGLSDLAETALLQQLHTRRSDLQQEWARLEVEHGPNYPRVVEIGREVQNLDAQIEEARGRLREHSRIAWRTAVERERSVQKSLQKATDDGLRLSSAELKYSQMQREASANREMYVRLMQAAEEANITAGIRRSEISVIDYARQPVKPVSPNLPVDLGITLVASIWAALGVVLGREALRREWLRAAAVLVCALALSTGAHSQAPTPNISGLPAGVAHIPQSGEMRSVPNAKDPPGVWSSGPETRGHEGPAGVSHAVPPFAAQIGPGDTLEITESRTPEMHASVRVSEAGTVVLPLAGEVNLSGKDEQSAAQAIDAALIERGMLRHPQVTVMVTAYAGKDVAVLGEVTRPGVYSYGVHHRLLDLISAASGLTQSAGRLAFVTHRDDPPAKTLPVAFDPSGTDLSGEHNPELLPGDTVQVSRAGLVYVVGDVIRPGGFPIDPYQATTVVRALSLAWGPAQNAALTKAVLIREQPGGRTLTTLNLKRMLRGLDPDVPLRDRDILFVPDSMAKNLMNRSLESMIQSAAGVSIYSGLVYSQRF